MFDLLYLNDISLIKKPFYERRRLLYEHFQEVEGEWKFATKIDANDIEQVQHFLDDAVKGSCFLCLLYYNNIYYCFFSF